MRAGSQRSERVGRGRTSRPTYKSPPAVLLQERGDDESDPTYLFRRAGGGVQVNIRPADYDGNQDNE